MATGRELILKRTARFFKDGQLVNLGIGMPSELPKYIDKDINIVLQSENGALGIGSAPEPDEEDKDLTTAGGLPATMKPGGMCFDSCFSFALIRGGHVDITVLGALEVDQEGNLANYMIPNKLTPGMGGAMDLVAGTKTVIVAMDHCDKYGNPKIVKKCTLPLTAIKEVDYIVTELCTFQVTAEGLLLLETAPGVTPENVAEKTAAAFTVDSNLGCME